MPVRSVGDPPVVRDPCPESSGTSGATYVQVDATLESLASQRANADRPRVPEVEQQNVGPRGGGELVGARHIPVGDLVSMAIA